MNAERSEKLEFHRDMQAVVKLYCLRGKTSTKTYEKMISVYVDNYLSQT